MSETSEVVQPDGAPATDTATSEPADAQLGDAGKRALDALRSENKDLKSRLKALEASVNGTRDAVDNAGNPAGDTRDAVTAVEPTTQPRFEGTADGGSMRSAAPVAAQLKRADLRGMSAAAIEKARKNGQLRDLLNGK